MKNLYELKKEYNYIIEEFFNLKEKQKLIYAEINDFEKLKEKTKYGKAYESISFYDNNKKLIGNLLLLCDHTYFSLINRNELLNLARNLEIGIENLYINDGNEGSNFIAIIKDVYNKIIELENNK